ncbi:MAG: Tyrosine recombinase XerC [Pelotomaculum sp. PtaU1.Bin065]|nr:MAG: Tyrosine recombinase XerC [Pelotomaculum sp. PtaU1.Bin065]
MKNTSHNYLDQFFAHLTTLDLSPNTVSAYRIDMADFGKRFVDTNGREMAPADVTSIDLRDYQGYLQTVRGLKPATVNRRLNNVRNFLKWAREAGYLERMPNVPRKVQAQPTPPKALERNEQNRLLREVERRGKLRDMALVRLLLSCGLRVSEAVLLQVSDLDIGERHGKLTVRQGKGNKWREVPVPPEARCALKDWLEERERKYNACPWLFPNKCGSHITARRVEQSIKNYGYFAGLNVHPHILRHAAATNMLRSGADLPTVAQILGHSSINTTAIYTKPDNRTMAEAVERGEV